MKRSILTIALAAATVFNASAQQGINSMYSERLTPPATAEFQKLADNPELAFFKKTRAEMQKDPQYPKYHYLVPEHNSGDPNGLCYWQGNWHLFYQYRALNTPGLKERVEKGLMKDPTKVKPVLWGHAVSPDLVHWQDLPVALWPKVGNQCFSGSALVEDDRTLVIYHATGAGNQIVEANDPLLLDWKYIGKHPGQEVTIGFSPKDANGYPTYKVWDPFMFKDGDMYYSVVGAFMYYSSSGNVMGPNLGDHLRRATWWLFSSPDLIDWKCDGRMLENDPFTELGDDGSCTYLWPLGQDKHLLIFFSHRIGSQLMVGTFDKEKGKFIPTAHQYLNTGPASASPAPGQPGNVIVTDVKGGNYTGKGGGGWNGIFTLPRCCGLGEFDQLTITPAGNTDSLRGEKTTIGGLPLTLRTGEEEVLKGINGNALEISAEIDLGNSSLIEMNVLRSPDAREYTSIRLVRDGERYNRHGGQRWTLSIDTSHGWQKVGIGHKLPSRTEFLRFNDEPFRLRVFLDVSIIEVFVNDKAHLAERSYPMLPNSTGVSIRSDSGGRLEQLQAWPMGTIY
ncbi:glycoside hydrolase family 32 protein [bacterium]|nr:glycoside hydrolase family 32 protein [bacterium]